jgi:hypothetical protein
VDNGGNRQYDSARWALPPLDGRVHLLVPAGDLPWGVLKTRCGEARHCTAGMPALLPGGQPGPRHQPEGVRPQWGYCPADRAHLVTEEAYQQGLADRAVRVLGGGSGR